MENRSAAFMASTTSAGVTSKGMLTMVSFGAQAASAALGLPVQVLDFMREVHWGSRDGSPLFAGGHPWNIADELARQGFDLTRADWRAHAFFRNNTVLDSVDLVEKGIDEWLESLGYVRDGFYYRCERPDSMQKLKIDAVCTKITQP